MAKVLAAVPKSGLEAVLVAVELVLESGNPSAEHVENVLNRLKAAPPPDCVETSMEVAAAPVADTGRYDRLREEASHALSLLNSRHCACMEWSAPGRKSSLRATRQPFSPPTG